MRRINWPLILCFAFCILFWFLVVRCLAEPKIDVDRVILTWKCKSVLPLGNGVVWFTFENPNPPPKEVVLVLTPGLLGVLSYRYFLDGEPVLFVWYKTEFVKFQLTDENKRDCLSCHRQHLMKRKEVNK
jgi:hypothetical protein